MYPPVILPKERKEMRHRWWDMWCGCPSPQLTIQLTPFCWGYGCGWGPDRLCLRFGPLSIRLFWTSPEFDCHWDSHNSYE